MYRVSLGITTSMSVETTGWIAAGADSLGADGVWIGEDIGVGQDTNTLAASVILQSKRVRVGTGIIPIAPHNTSTIARASIALQEMANGRYALGIGIGGVQDIQRIGITLRRPVTELRRTVNILRALWSGQSVSKVTELHNLREYQLRLREAVDIPVFFGVRGPKMLALAGEISDGVILSGPRDYLKKAVEMVDSAARKAGRDPSGVEKIVWVPTVPTFRGMKERTGRKIVALIVADTPSVVLDMLDLNRDDLERIRSTVSREGPKAAAAMVSREILDAFAICGSKEYMVDRFDDLSRTGATEIVLGPPYSGEWREAIREILQEVASRRGG
ncbi:MAG: LLM class flavin-dependent oxidoreductase [Candidatus Thorarchaeota archaeon]|nr:MAG: hypothetical protein DRP09_08165 [Candidatus Thorarchaeota archaeon]RLI59396.1 MAG: hypothetical protein DRO87_03095 [Candidatus Thorarchaeota archaeon]